MHCLCSLCLITLILFSTGNSGTPEDSTVWRKGKVIERVATKEHTLQLLPFVKAAKGQLTGEKPIPNHSPPGIQASLSENHAVFPLQTKLFSFRDLNGDKCDLVYVLHDEMIASVCVQRCEMNSGEYHTIKVSHST